VATGSNCAACQNQQCRTGVLNDCNAACTCQPTGTTTAPGGLQRHLRAEPGYLRDHDDPAGNADHPGTGDDNHAATGTNELLRHSPSLPGGGLYLALLRRQAELQTAE